MLEKPERFLKSTAEEPSQRSAD